MRQYCLELAALAAMLSEKPRLDILSFLATRGAVSVDILAGELGVDIEELEEHLEELAEARFVSLAAGIVDLGDGLEFDSTAEGRTIGFTTPSGGGLRVTYPTSPERPA